MPKSYLATLLALVGWLILTAADHPSPKGSAEQTPAQQSIATSLKNISARYDQYEKRAESADKEEKPCGERKYSSNADLCAQWKAADAAADSAWWAWAAGIAGIVSTFGVIGALGISLNSNRIARDTARRELRAYVSNDMGEPTISADGDLIRIAVPITNRGSTPAYECRHYGDVVQMTDAQMQEYLSDKTESACKGVPPRFTLHPTQEYAGDIRPSTHIPWHLLEEIGEEHRIYVYGMVWYNDAFGCERETRFCYWLEALEPSIPIESADPGTDIFLTGIMRFRMAHFHNFAT